MDIEKELEAFEKWRVKDMSWGGAIDKDKYGNYVQVSTWSMWNAWKARAELCESDKES